MTALDGTEAKILEVAKSLPQVPFGRGIQGVCPADGDPLCPPNHLR